MGIDVEMFAAINSTRTDQEIFAAAIQMRQKFDMWVERERRRHCLTPVNHDDTYYEMDGGVPEGMRLIEAHTLMRYYGPGYERGNCLSIIGMAEFLEFTWPEAVVWYGGDSGSGLERFDATARDELKQHFYRVGNAPYYDRSFGLEDNCPECDWCNVPIAVNMAAGNWRSGGCRGCGGKFIYSPDSGWVEMGEYEKFDDAKARVTATREQANQVTTHDAETPKASIENPSQNNPEDSA